MTTKKVQKVRACRLEHPGNMAWQREALRTRNILAVKEVTLGNQAFAKPVILKWLLFIRVQNRNRWQVLPLRLGRAV